MEQAAPPAVVRVMLLALGALAVACMFVSFTWPLAYNHAVYLQSAQIALADPHSVKELMDTKGPMSYLLLVPALALVGDGVIALRLTDLFFVVAGTCGMWLVLRSDADRPTALIGALCIPLISYAFGFRRTGEPDAWMAMSTLLLVGMSLNSQMYHGRTRAGVLVFAGALGVAGLFLKPFYILTAGLPLLLSVDVRDARRRFLVLATTMIASLAITIAVMTQLGLFATWLDIQFGFNLSSYSALDALTPADRVMNVETVLMERLPFSSIVWLPWLAFAVVRLSPLKRPHDRLLLGSLLLGGFYMLLQGRLITYQAFAFVLPAASLVAVALVRMSAAEASPVVRAVVGSTLLASIMVAPVDHLLTYLKSVRHHESMTAYWDRFEYLGNFSPGDDVRAATLIQAITSDSARVEVWGQNSALLYLSRRRTPTTFVAWVMLAGRASPRRTAYRARYLRAFDSTSPAVVVAAEEGRRAVIGTHMRKFFPELADRVALRYSECQRFGHLTVFVLRTIDTGDRCAPHPSISAPSGGAVGGATH